MFVISIIVTEAHLSLFLAPETQAPPAPAPARLSLPTSGPLAVECRPKLDNDSRFAGKSPHWKLPTKAEGVVSPNKSDLCWVISREQWHN